MTIEAWFMDESDGDQRLPHHRSPPELVSLDHLADVGFLYWKLNPSDYENDEELRKIREARGYNYMDESSLALILDEPWENLFQKEEFEEAPVVLNP